MGLDSSIDRLLGFAKSENGRLTLCAICASLVTAGTMYGFSIQQKLHSRKDKWRQAIHDAEEAHDAVSLNAVGGPARPKRIMDEELILEQLSRNYLFFGDAGMERIRNSFVVVVGVGGVGSWATTMLVRSGVGKVRIIDFDQVTLSSLNRHAVATLADVGTPKIAALEKHLSKVAPWVNVEGRNDLFRKEDADELLEPWNATGQRPDFVIDAIDNIETKADLLAYCHDHAIPVIASMGAGCKSDPTRIFLSDISETNEDPLSRATRRHLKLRGIRSGIPTVYSTEKPGPGKAQLKPLEEERFAGGRAGEYSILPDFRSRLLPVLGTMPAIFGLTLVTHVLTTLAGYPTEPVRGKSRKSLYESAYRELQRQHQGGDRIPLTLDDVAFLIEELACGKSVIPPHFPQKLTLVHWDPSKALTISNVIVVTKEEAERHTEEVLRGARPFTSVYTEEEFAAIRTNLERSAALQAYRCA